MRALFVFMTMGLVMSEAMSLPCLADEDSDLNLIPQTVVNNRSQAVSAFPLSSQVFFENAVTAYDLRKSLPVALPVGQADWQDRLSLDLRSEWKDGDHFNLLLSDRFNAFVENDFAFGSQQTARNSLREFYASDEIAPRIYVEAGRINQRNGSALGFNPTDFFKTRTLVTQATIDPSALRNDRLGTVMIRSQRIWEGGSATVAYAPKLQETSGLEPQAVLNPGLGQTNDQNRWFASLSFEAGDLSPEMVFYRDSIRTKGGINLTHVIGKSVVTYVEWAGGREENLSQRAVEFGQATGELPSYAPIIPQSAQGTGFKNDLAVGGSWTFSSKLTLNLEYHYHQAALNSASLQTWSSLGANPFLSSELWYIREYASAEQEPWAQQQVFWRIDWPDGLVNRLDLGWLGFISPLDGSSLQQLSSSYALSDSWTVEAYLDLTAGGPASVYGSLSQLLAGVAQLRMFF